MKTKRTEISKRTGVAKVPLHVKIDKQLDDVLRDQAQKRGMTITHIVTCLVREFADNPSRAFKI